MKETVITRKTVWSLSQIVAITILALLLSHCSRHSESDAPLLGEEKEFMFSIKIPKEFSPVSYSLSEAKESEIRTVDVLLFEKDGNFLSGPHYGLLDESNVSVMLPLITEEVDISIFANSRAVLDAVTYSESHTKADVLKQLTASITPGDADKEGGITAGWNTSESNYTPIPMWAEVTVASISEGMTVSTTPIELTRMLAKITLDATTVDVTEINKTRFNLTSIYLCNYNRVGRIAPVGMLPSVSGTDGDGLTDVKKTGAETAIKYDVPEGDNTSQYDIYTFEAANGSYDVDNPCLVIVGTFDDDTRECYYRIDFYGRGDETAPDRYLDLLRNNIYRVSLKKIIGLGQNSVANAIKSTSSDIESNISPWTVNVINPQVQVKEEHIIHQGGVRL